MTCFSHYNEHELKYSFELTKNHRPQLAELIEEVNELLQVAGSENRYHVWAQEYIVKSKWPWQDDKMEFVCSLLFGPKVTTNSVELQVLNLPSTGFEATLYGFINGFNTHPLVPPQTPPAEMWKKFIHTLNEVDDLDTKSFIGSTDRYKKIFLQANK